MAEMNFGESFKLYSDGQRDPVKRTGLNVQYTETRANYPTISIEIAPIRAAGAKADWGAEDHSTTDQGRADRVLRCDVWAQEGCHRVIPW